jgi:hypothetical protein
MPLRILARVNGSVRPSRLRTCMYSAVIRSAVEKRLLQLVHIRLRMVSPLHGRVSLTFVLSLPQNGHFMIQFYM